MLLSILAYLKMLKNLLFKKDNLITVGVLIVIIYFPIIYKYLSTPEGYWFTGQVSWFDPQDINLYVSMIKVGNQGQLLALNLYDSLSSQPLPILGD